MGFKVYCRLKICGGYEDPVEGEFSGIVHKYPVDALEESLDARKYDQIDCTWIREVDEDPDYYLNKSRLNSMHGMEASSEIKKQPNVEEETL